MLLREVDYVRPGSVAEAVGLLAGNRGARPLAGGQTLINALKAIAVPAVLVDLNDLPELREIRETDTGLELGAMVTCSQLILAAEVHRVRPILADVAAQIADVQVRNRGTIGGNLCSNDPTNHLPPLVAALGATMTIAGADGEREVPADEFFRGVDTTAVQPGELLTRIAVPRRAQGDGFASVTVGREGTCIVSAAAALGTSLRIALGCVAARPVVIEPESTDDDTVRAAVQAAGLAPPSDVHGPGGYRSQLAAVLAVRAARQARGES